MAALTVRPWLQGGDSLRVGLPSSCRCFSCWSRSSNRSRCRSALRALLDPPRHRAAARQRVRRRTAPGRSASIQPARAPTSAGRRRRSRCSWVRFTWRRAGSRGGWCSSRRGRAAIAAVVDRPRPSHLRIHQAVRAGRPLDPDAADRTLRQRNHTAEFLELAAFICLACSFFRRTRSTASGGWSARCCAPVGALATLSRGAVAALAGGAWCSAPALRQPPGSAAATGRRRTGMMWGRCWSASSCSARGALGAEQLVDRFRTGSIGGDLRFALWRDGLRVFARTRSASGGVRSTRISHLPDGEDRFSAPILVPRERAAPAARRFRMAVVRVRRRRRRRGRLVCRPPRAQGQDRSRPPGWSESPC